MKAMIGITCGIRRDEGVYSCGKLYAAAVKAAGGEAVLLPPDFKEIGFLDGIILSGGGDIHPYCYGSEPVCGLGQVDLWRDVWEIELASLAIKNGKGVLGICRGLQVLNVALGGTIKEDLGDKDLLHEQKAPKGQPWHHVSITEDYFIKLLGREASVNSHHHQAVDRLGIGLTPFAHASDGVIEGMYLSTKPLICGVQWHPELLTADFSEERALFEKFVRSCARHSRKN